MAREDFGDTIFNIPFTQVKERADEYYKYVRYDNNTKNLPDTRLGGPDPHDYH